jgi:hypothetical protein
VCTVRIKVLPMIHDGYPEKSRHLYARNVHEARQNYF